MTEKDEKHDSAWIAWLQKRRNAIWTNLQTNNLWRRILKNTIATTICAILAVLPAVVATFGTAAYLAPIVTVFGHPGRRFGQMAEALVLAVMGALIGTAWSTLGIYLSSLVVLRSQHAAYTIKALFLVVSFLVHGFLRSHSPRLFLGVVIEVIVSVVSLTGATQFVSLTLITTLLYPILSAVGVILVVNAVIYPEFSSSFLGVTTIETLEETASTLRQAGAYFVQVSDDGKQYHQNAGNIEEPQSSKATVEAPEDRQIKYRRLWRRPLQALRLKKSRNATPTPNALEEVKLPDLTAGKAKLRAKLSSCEAAQQECSFELAYAVLSPKDLEVIGNTAMKKIVANTIAIIAACESKYALMGDAHGQEEAKQEEKKQELGERANDSQGSYNDGRGDVKTADEPEPTATPSSKPRGRQRIPLRLLPGVKSRPSSKNRKSSKNDLAKQKDYIDRVKPQREIESGNIKLLRRLLTHISSSVVELQAVLDRSVGAVSACLAYCYDVEKLPSGAMPPTGIWLEELDIRVDVLVDAITLFDQTSSAALEKAAALQMKLDNNEGDVMPRMETFLISSFLLNLRQAAAHTLEMLRHCRVIVEKRQSRHGRKTLHPPTIKFKKWLSSGDREDQFAMPQAGKRTARKGGGDATAENEDGTSSQETLVQSDSPGDSAHAHPPSESNVRPSRPRRRKASQSVTIRSLRIKLADTIDYLFDSEDVFYAIKLTIAAFLVVFPAFIPSFNEFFRLNRALWAVLQLVLVFEVALGVSVWTFFLRALGTTIGCIWGYAAYEAGSGNRVVMMVILVIGFIPSAYIQLGSKYIKAGMVSIISMSIVAIGTLEPSVPGTATQTFLRRLIAFFIGGVVALAVEVLFFPTRARDRLVESVATSIKQISDMEACIAYGVESEKNVTDVQSLEVLQRFDRAKGKAQIALTAAETFLPACAHEPRLKGSFKGHALIYSEILYVLHAIVDRMDGMHHLRHAYGSGVLEEFNSQIYAYRRNVSGAITLILFACHEALITRLPLPQFLPSARLAHLRLVNRVREIVVQRHPRNIGDSGGDGEGMKLHPEIGMVKKIFHKKFLAWNAVAAGHVEVIEYLEELVELVKLLVGADEFQSGLFVREGYFHDAHHDPVSPDGQPGQDNHNNSDATKRDEEEERDVMPTSEVAQKRGIMRKRTMSSTLQKHTSADLGLGLSRSMSRTTGSAAAGENELPPSLQRVRSRRLEEMELRRVGSGEGRGWGERIGNGNGKGKEVAR